MKRYVMESRCQGEKRLFRVQVKERKGHREEGQGKKKLAEGCERRY